MEGSGSDMELRAVHHDEQDDDGQGLLSSLEPDDGGDHDSFDDDEFESESRLEVFDVEKHARMVVVILKPVSFTMALVVWMVRVIHTVVINVE